MAINLQTETILSLNEAARRLPPSRQGRPVSLSCIYRWILQGVRTPQGKVRLEGVRMGGRWLTSVEALQRFAESLTPSRADAPAPPRSPAARHRDSERAARQCEQLGI